jgi:hypothetical protein
MHSHRGLSPSWENLAMFGQRMDSASTPGDSSGVNVPLQGKADKREKRLSP